MRAMPIRFHPNLPKVSIVASRQNVSDRHGFFVQFCRDRRSDSRPSFVFQLFVYRPEGVNLTTLAC